MPYNDPYTREEDTRFTLRIPTQLLDVVKAIARRNKRSTGKQVEFMLEDWIREHVPTDKTEPDR